MDNEKANYIISHFRHLMTTQEKLAWRHYASTLKLSGNDNPTMTKMYKMKGWLSDDPNVLDLLQNGYDDFEKNTAKRILINNHEEVFLNNCPKCNKLARTPKAKQCRHCGYDWHDK